MAKYAEFRGGGFRVAVDMPYARVWQGSEEFGRFHIAQNQNPGAPDLAKLRRVFEMLCGPALVLAASELTENRTHLDLDPLDEALLSKPLGWLQKWHTVAATFAAIVD